jgi:hypothetical protein
MQNQRIHSMPYERRRGVEAAVLALVLAEDWPWRVGELGQWLRIPEEVIGLVPPPDEARLQMAGKMPETVTGDKGFSVEKCFEYAHGGYPLGGSSFFAPQRSRERANYPTTARQRPALRANPSACRRNAAPEPKLSTQGCHLPEPTAGIEPATPGLQNRCSAS